MLLTAVKDLGVATENSALTPWRVGRAKSAMERSVANISQSGTRGGRGDGGGQGKIGEVSKRKDAVGVCSSDPVSSSDTVIDGSRGKKRKATYDGVKLLLKIIYWRCKMNTYWTAKSTDSSKKYSTVCLYP